MANTYSKYDMGQSMPFIIVYCDKIYFKSIVKYNTHTLTHTHPRAHICTQFQLFFHRNISHIEHDWTESNRTKNNWCDSMVYISLHSHHEFSNSKLCRYVYIYIHVHVSLLQNIYDIPLLFYRVHCLSLFMSFVGVGVVWNSLHCLFLPSKLDNFLQ